MYPTEPPYVGTVGLSKEYALRAIFSYCGQAVMESKSGRNIGGTSGWKVRSKE